VEKGLTVKKSLDGNAILFTANGGGMSEVEEVTGV
jgi:hypothetical protein